MFGGNLKRITLGLPDTPEGWTEATRRLKSIQSDIDFGTFDLTLEKYKPKTKQQDYLKIVRELYPKTTLIELWNRYVSYKKPTIKTNTLFYLETTLGRHIKKSNIDSPYKALEIREYLLANTTESITKRVIINLNAAFKWAIKHNLVKAPNPYEGMAKEFKHKYEKEVQPNAFTSEQSEAIIKAFQNNIIPFSRYSYSYYTNFVRFLFLTGCRPHEAIGLTWQDVTEQSITFDGGISIIAGKFYRTHGSKNNKKRKFPCNEILKQLLENIRPKNVNLTDLVFPSPEGNPINYPNFCRRAWDSVVNPIKPDTTPYNCRDTFITQQISKGIPLANIAKWVDTSVQIIEKHYFDVDSIDYILPQ